MASLLRTAAKPIARLATPRAPPLGAPLIATLTTTAHRANSTPPAPGPRQPPRKSEEERKHASKESMWLSPSFLVSGGIATVLLVSLYSARSYLFGPSPSSPSFKRLSYTERLQDSLSKSQAGGGVNVFHSAAADIDGEDSPTSGERTEEEDAGAGQEAQEDQGEGQEAAYDPSTGQINWDCPCLGGMASGPCGEEFKEAFSCFVFSEAEPKGVECVDKFKGMQDCFRRHPEEYKEELEMEEEDESQSLIDEVEQALGLPGKEPQQVVA